MVQKEQSASAQFAHDSCCKAGRAFAAPAQQRLVADFMTLSACLEVHHLSYADADERNQWALESVFGNSSQSISPLLVAGKTTMQFYLLLSNAWRIRTRYVLHMDMDAVLFWVPSSAMMQQRSSVSALEAFIRYAQRQLGNNPEMIAVVAGKCRARSACLPSCQPHKEQMITESFVFQSDRFRRELSCPASASAALGRQQCDAKMQVTHWSNNRSSIRVETHPNHHIEGILHTWATRRMVRYQTYPFGHAPSSTDPLGAVCHDMFKYLKEAAEQTEGPSPLDGAQCCSEDHGRLRSFLVHAASEVRQAVARYSNASTLQSTLAGREPLVTPERMAVTMRV
eukprot:6214459-Prymnesium_polylepis.1